MQARSLEVIVPVRDGERLLQECLLAVMPQLAPGDAVTVVDDASVDGTAAVAGHAGASVMQLKSPVGPYRARQVAASRSGAWGLVFLDVRCRPLDGWLESHRELLHRPGNAMSCSVVVAVAGSSLASRVAAYQQPFRLEATIGEGRKPYYPTCNLGMRRDVFVAAGGFTGVRSGGDADLCWRVQELGLGALGIDAETRVVWEPRSRLRDLAEQWWRYGVSGAALARRAGDGLPSQSLGRQVWGRLLGLMIDVRDRKVALHVGVLSLLMEGLQRLGHLRGSLMGRARVLSALPARAIRLDEDGADELAWFSSRESPSR